MCNKEGRRWAWECQRHRGTREVWCSHCGKGSKWEIEGRKIRARKIDNEEDREEENRQIATAEEDIKKLERKNPQCPKNCDAARFDQWYTGKAMTEGKPKEKRA